MSIPEHLQYTAEHEWVREEDDGWVVGITHHAQDQLGDVVFVELPEVGAEIIPGDTFGTVESVKAVSDLFAPIQGTVLEVNGSLEDTPEVVNSDPYGAGWMLKVQRADDDSAQLLTAEAYQELIGG